MLLAFVQRVSQDAGACALFPAYVIDLVMQQSPEVMIPFLNREDQKEVGSLLLSYVGSVCCRWVLLLQNGFPEI